MARSYRLPQFLDLAFANRLHGDLSALRGGDVEVDGSDVQTAGGLGLQLLLAADAAWKREGWRITVVNRSPALDEAFRLAGAVIPGSTS